MRVRIGFVLNPMVRMYFIFFKTKSPTPYKESGSCVCFLALWPQPGLKGEGQGIAALIFGASFTSAFTVVAGMIGRVMYDR